jgi:endonuclease YncB( thermonuclease family)
MTTPIYRYENCTLIRVVDGDTFIATLDVGFNFTTTQRIRLMGCDMPERHQPGGREATLHLKNYLELAQRLVITTVKQDSFGRWLAWVHRDGERGPSATVEMVQWHGDWQARQAAAQPAGPSPLPQEAP